MGMRVSTAITGLMVTCSLAVAGLAIRNVLIAPPTARLSREAWGDALATGRWIGDSTAQIRIVEFADFQCPACARLAPRLKTLVEGSSGRVALLYRHFPLTEIHASAFDAAVAAECAGAVDRFGQMHDVLYRMRDSIGTVPWTLFARVAMVQDTIAFSRCLGSSASRARVEADLRLARRLGLPGTPAFFLEGQVLLGGRVEELESAVEDLLTRP